MASGSRLARDGEDGAAGIPDAGALRNTALQFATQLAGAVFTGALTLYLVRALSPSDYGLYALAVSIGGLLVLPAGLGLPMAVGRFLADHRQDREQVRAILALGLRFQAPAAVLASVALFAAAGPVADAYGHPDLAWPLRGAAAAVAGQTMFSFLSSVSRSVRQSWIGLRMAVVESAVETAASASLVVAGLGAAGATLGKAIGYAVAAAGGLYLTLRLLRRTGTATTRRHVTRRTLMSYAGAMFLVDIGFNALAQLDVLLIGALLSTAAVGSFGAVWRVVVLLGYLGPAVAGGVAPRLSLGGGAPDTGAFNRAIRYLVITEGVVIAPMLVWAGPIVNLLFGPGYPDAAQILRALTIYVFVSTPAALISLSVSYLGEGRRRVAAVLGTLVVGCGAIYGLIGAVGVVGAAYGDDIIAIVYVAAHLWICSRLITVDMRTLARSLLRTLMAAGAMALPLLAIGVDRLGAIQSIIGLIAGGLAYGLVLLVTGEVSVGEVRRIASVVRAELRPNH
ncbi:MAG: oligosaccharide flippase family protein [Solirubrobacteraceae bacterium]